MSGLETNSSELEALRAENAVLRSRLHSVGLHATDLRIGLESERAAAARLERRADDLSDLYAELSRITEALAVSEARHRAILESATDYAIVATDLEGRVTTWNEGARRILGFEEAEILGQSLDVIFIPEDRSAGVPDQERQTALIEGRAMDERWHVRREGARFWASGMMMPLRVDGGVHGFLKIMRDRSGDREAEIRQQRADERLQLALGVAGVVGIWEWDLARDLVFADANFARIYGLPPEVAEAGASLDLFNARHHPEDLPALKRGMLAARDGGEQFAQQYRVVRPDGTVRWVLARGDVVSEAGRPVRFPGAVIDITETKRAELMQSALVQLTDRFRDTADAGEMAFAAAEAIGQALGLSRAGYGSVDAKGAYLDVERDWRADGVSSITGRHYFADYGTFVEDLKRGETLAIDDVTLFPGTAADADKFLALEIRAMVNVPVIEHGKLVAVLFLHDDQVRHWSPDKLAFVREAAQRTRDAVERRRAEDQQGLLMNELQHRVKNTLTLVQAIASQTFRGEENAGARDAFANRVVALGRANDVLTKAGWTAASMADLVAGVIGPYGEDPRRFDITGPPIELAAQGALSITMALHELCTNAAKYGALSKNDGRVVLAWRIEEDGTFRLVWREHDGPPVRRPERQGFGSRLLERTLGSQFGGEVRIDYAPDGLVCTFTAPFAHLGTRAA